jgi:hypothetical protein
MKTLIEYSGHIWYKAATPRTTFSDREAAALHRLKMMKIAEIIARENLLAPAEKAILEQDVRHYIAGSARNQGELLACRGPAPLSPSQLHSFFRRREREENTCLILQYLLMFSEILSPGNTALPEPEAAIQMTGVVRYQVDLLQQRDVRTAIMREYSQLGILKHANLWYYEGRIDDMHRDLSALLSQADEKEVTVVLRLCCVLERLSLFWFDICREDVRRVRSCDLYIYKLALLIQHGQASPANP